MKKIKDPKMLVVSIGVLLLLVLMFYFRITAQKETVSFGSLVTDINGKINGSTTGKQKDGKNKQIPIYTNQPEKTIEPKTGDTSSMPVQSAQPTPEPTPDLDPTVPEMAPDFELYDCNGAKVKLSDYKGKVVFLNFFATWCSSSADESVDLVRANKKLKEGNKGVIIGVNIRESAGVIKNYMSENRIEYRCLLDPESQAAKLYNITSIPATCIIGRDGKLYKKKIGTISEEEILVLADVL